MPSVPDGLALFSIARICLGRPTRKRNLFACFLEPFRAPQTHIDVLTDQETIVAHQALTYRAQVETMDGFLHRPGESPLFFPLIQQIEDDLLGFRLGSLPRLGKRHRCALPQFSAFRTNQVIHKFVGIGAIDQMLLNNPFHRPHPFLIPKFFDFTVAVLCTQIHCMIMYLRGIFPKYIICLVHCAWFSAIFLWKIPTIRARLRL